MFPLFVVVYTNVSRSSIRDSNLFSFLEANMFVVHLIEPVSSTVPPKLNSTPLFVTSPTFSKK